MKIKDLARWRLPLAFVIAPLLGLAACDQVKRAADKIEKSLAPAAASGPAPLSSVAPAARALAGKVQPEALRAATLAPDPVLFVPGDVIVGAKVQDKVLEMAPPKVAAQLRAQFALGGPPPQIDADLQRRATEAAVADATKGAHTVLDRLGVDATVSAGAGGMLKIDLNPEKASPTQLSTAPPSSSAPSSNTPSSSASSSAPAPAAPQLAQDNGLKCPKGVTEAQLNADLALKTQCAIERLNAAHQFQYVEKNYVVAVGFDGPFAFTPRAQAAPVGSAAPVVPAAPPPAPESAAPAQADAGLPDDPLLAFQWDFRPRGAGAGQAPGGAGFEDFWTKAHQTGSREVRVAVIDTGIDRKHPDIAASPNIGAGIDLIADPDRAGDGDGVDTDANDEGDHCGAGGADSFHGTHVAGTIGAAVTNDRKGVAGAAWNVTIIPVRAIGRCGGELEDIVNAVRWSAGLAPAQTAAGQLVSNQQPADIINMSISVGIPCPQSLQVAINDAVAHGVLVVVAAGNKAAEAKDYAPGNCANVIAVAANDEKGDLAYYSNYGPEVALMAPGGDVFADADGDGRPDGILSTRTTSADCYDPQTGQPASACYYSYLQGTSMAAPHVAAALALLKAQLHLSGKQLLDALMTRAVTPVGSGQCSVACTKDQADGPISGQAGLCLRSCGRGMLDMAHAAVQP